MNIKERIEINNGIIKIKVPFTVLELRNLITSIKGSYSKLIEDNKVRFVVNDIVFRVDNYLKVERANTFPYGGHNITTKLIAAQLLIHAIYT